MRRIALLSLCLLLLLPLAATGKDYKSNTAGDVGYIWLFMYDSHAGRIEIDPALAYGGTLFQVIDFSWARNMVAEVHYLTATARGEGFNWTDDDSTLFDLTIHHMSFNPGYFFEGRRLHPYISGGFGAAYVLFEPFEGEDKKEWDLDMNLSGGVDFTVWETGMAALERVDLGFRARYLYVFQRDIVDTAINGLALTLRLNLRW